MMSTIWLETCRGIWKDIINKCIRLETRNQIAHQLLAYTVTISVTFEAVSWYNVTTGGSVYPLFKHLLEQMFWRTLRVCRMSVNTDSIWITLVPIPTCNVGKKKKKIARCQIWRIQRMAKIFNMFYGAKTRGQRKRHRHEHFHSARAKYNANVQVFSEEQSLYPGQVMHEATLFRSLSFGKKIKVSRVLVATNKWISTSDGLTTKF